MGARKQGNKSFTADGADASVQGAAGGGRAAGNGDRLTDDERRERIAIIAYSRAEQRGFDSSLALEDWLEAERQVDDEIAARASRVTSGDGDSSGPDRTR